MEFPRFIIIEFLEVIPPANLSPFVDRKMHYYQGKSTNSEEDEKCQSSCGRQQ